MKRISAPEQTREQLPHSAGTVQLGAAGGAADPGGSLGGRGSRPDWPGALRAGRRRSEGLPKWIQARPDEDGGGHG